MDFNEFKLDLQAVLEKAKSIANIKRDIKIIEAKLPKIKLQGTLNSTSTRKELNNKLKSVNPKVKIDADTTLAEKKMKKLNQQKTNPTITPTVDNSQVVSGLKEAQKETKTLWERFTNGIFGINLIRMGIQEVARAVRLAIANVKELDAVKTNIQMVSGTSDSGVNAMMSSYNSMAKDLSSTTKDVAEAANEFLRMGESVASTNELIKSSQVLSKVGMIESAESASYLISSLKGYKVAAKDSMDVVSKLTSVDLEAAVSAGGLAEALSKCSNIANNSGTSMDRLIGYTATVGEVTQKSMSEVGNSFQSIFSRMNNIKIGRFVDDETGESLSDTEKVLNKLGIQLRDTEDSYRSFDDVLDDIGNRWRDFTKVERNAISVAIAGTRQRENFEALMNNYGDALKYSETAANSAGSALERYGIFQDSIQAKTNELTTAIESLSTNVISEDMFSGIIEATTGVVEFIDKTNILKGTLAGFVTMGISKAFVSMATGIIVASKSTAQLTAAMALFDKGRSADNLKDIGTACKGLSDQQLKLVLSTKGLTDAQRQRILEGMGLEEQEIQQTLATLGFAEAENVATVSTFSFKGALNSLKTAVAMNPIGALATAISAVTIAFSVYKQYQEELIQSTQESASAYKESASSIEDYASQYQELHKALLDAKGNEEETYNVKRQLLDLQTELNDKFGEEYGKLNLVTDAYKDQTEAIKAYNKEKANAFLNENREGIESATREMTEERTYNLSYTGVSSETDEGAVLKEIAEKYADQGVRINTDKDTGTYNIILEADAQSAYDTINAFETDVRNKAIELGDKHMFDDVLEISSTELNNAKKVIDEYSEIYRQALTAEITSDDNKSKVYGEALQAVEAYNEAVLKSEDPYNDSNVLEAKENLDAVKESIQGNEEEWGKYSAITDDVFAQADTRILDFKEKLKNDSGLQALANDLNGLSYVDLKALDENVGDNESFDKLKASADEYEVSVDELINALVRLGYVQGEVQNSASDPALKNSIRQKLSVEANDEAVNEWINNLTAKQADIVNSPEFQKSLDKQKEKILKSNADTLSDLENQYSEARQTIADEYQKISDLGLDDYADDIKSGAMQSTFGNVDMDKRTIIEWSDELKQTYADALSSWDYAPEIGSIDSVLGKSDRFGKDLNGIGWEVAFTPILPDGTLIDKDTVYQYINTILQEAYSNDGKITEDELRYIDLQGRQIGSTFIKGIFAGIDDSQNYENNGNWADTVSRMMQFSGDSGSIGYATDHINNELNPAIDNARENLDNVTLSTENYSKALEDAQNKIAEASFDQVWADSFTSEDENVKELCNSLLELAEKGRLTVDTFNEADSTEYFKNFGISADIAVSKINKMVDESKQLSSMSSQISKMSEALATKKENGFVEADTLAGFDVEVRGLESWDRFQTVLGSTTSSYQECQEAANELATEWVNSNDFLAQLTEDTKEYYETQLEAMGVENYEEVIESTLALKEAKEALAEVDLSEATSEEIQNLIDENGYLGETADAIWTLYNAKIAEEATTINTSADCQNLIDLCGDTDRTSQAVQLLIELMDLYNMMEGDTYKTNGTVQDYVAQRVDEIKSELEGLSNGEGLVTKPQTKVRGSSGKKSGGGSGSSKDTYKEAYEKELKELERMHKLGLISDEEYWQARMNLNEKYFGESSGMHEKYLEEYQENEEDILEGLKKLWEDYYDERKNNLKDLISYAEKLYDGEIDSLEASIKVLEEKRDAEKKQWEEKIDAIGDEIDALEDANDERERAIDLQNKQWALQKAMHQRTILLYSENKGMHYVNDIKAERDARNDLDDAEHDNKVADLKKQQKDLEKQLDAILETYDEQIEAIEKQIDSLKEVKGSWSDIVENQEFKELEEKLKSLFGGDIKDKILSGNTDFINSIVSQYSDTSDMLRTIEDATLADIQNMVAQYGVLPENLMPVTDVISDITNVMGAVDTSGFNTNLDNTAQSSANATEKIQSTAAALNNLSNEVSSYQLPALNTDNFMSAFSEEGGIISALNRFMERYKEICDGIPEIWNNSLAEAFGQGGGNADPLAGGLPNDRKYDSLFDPLVDALNNCRTNMEAKLKECLGVFSTFQADLSNIIGIGGGSEDSGALQSGAEGAKGKGSGTGKGSGGEKDSGSGGGSDTIVGAIQEGGKLIDQALNGEEDSWNASFITAAGSIHNTASYIVECIESMVETIVNACIAAIEAINMLERAEGGAGNHPTPPPYSRIGHGHGEIGEAFADGTGVKGTPKAEKNAVVSEYGQREMTVFPNGKTVITDTPTAMDMPKGTVVYDEEQTDKILKNKVTATGSAYAEGTSKGDGRETFVLSDGTVLRTIPYDDPRFDIARKFEAFMKRTGDNVDIIARSGMIRYDNEMGELAKSVTNVNNVTNNDRHEQVIHQDIHVVLPNVTNATSAESLLRDLESIGRKKYQVNW